MKIQLKRSNVLEAGTAKEPTSAQMEYGELAVNYNGNDPALFIKDSNDNIIRIAGVGAVGSEVPSGGSGQRPIDPSIGDLYFDTDLDLILYYDGGNWVPVGEGAYVKVAGDNMTGNLTLGTNKITLNATSGSSSTESIKKLLALHAWHSGCRKISSNSKVRAKCVLKRLRPDYRRLL